MASSKLKGQALWSVVLQFSRFGGNAVVFFAMARFLTIEQIGAFGMAYAPIRWLQVLHKTGVSSSVVVTMRTRDADGNTVEEDPAFTGLFWMAMIITVVASLGVFGLSLLLGATQDTNLPVPQMMQVLIVVLVVFGLSSVPEGLLRKKMQIRSIALRTLAVQVLSAGLAVILAMQGAGAWALVGFAVMNAVLTSLLSIAMAGWWPKGGADFGLMRRLLPQASAISGRALVAGAVYAMLQFMIGLVLGLGAAGAFQIAQRVYQILDALCLAPIRFLVLPLFSRAAETGAGHLSGSTVERALGITGLLSAPFYLGTIVVAEPALTLVIGPENAGHSVFPLQLLCMLGVSISSVTILTQALTVVGRAGLAFRRTVWTLLATGALALPGLFVSVEAVTLGFVIASYVVLALFFRHLKPIFELEGTRGFLAVARPYMAGVVTLVPLWGGKLLMETQTSLPGWLLLPLLVPVAGLVYLGALRFIAPTALAELRAVLRV